jgi:hypothetical protein
LVIESPSLADILSTGPKIETGDIKMRTHILFPGAVALLIWAALAASLPGQAKADIIPNLINYQGRLTDTDDNPVTDGEYLVTFTIWKDPTSTAPTDRKWISPDCPVLVINGLFNWQLGSRESLAPWTIANDSALWLGIKVGADPELSPRTRLCAAPYAYKAWKAEYAGYADSAVALVSGCGESGAFDGEVNSDMVETGPGGITTINFAVPFTSTEKPHMYVAVVLKQAANGLWEGAAIKAVVDIKGTSGNWTGFEITVSKLSDGSSISDTTKVFVIWMAIRR